MPRRLGYPPRAFVSTHLIETGASVSRGRGVRFKREWRMYRSLGVSAYLAIALAMPVQDAAAPDPIGGAILGGAAGAIIGGAVGGGRGAATGAIVGGVTGAAIAAQGQ